MDTLVWCRVARRNSHSDHELTFPIESLTSPHYLVMIDPVTLIGVYGMVSLCGDFQV